MNGSIIQKTKLDRRIMNIEACDNLSGSDIGWVDIRMKRLKRSIKKIMVIVKP